MQFFYNTKLYFTSRITKAYNLSCVNKINGGIIPNSKRTLDVGGPGKYSNYIACIFDYFTVIPVNFEGKHFKKSQNIV